MNRVSRAVCAAVAVTAVVVGSVGLSASAQAATGDTWQGNQVLDVQPTATTQKVLLGLMTKYTGGSSDKYLWNSVRMVKDSNGHASWVFCIQQAQAGDSGEYVEDPTQAGTPEAQANAAKINRVLADSELTKPGSLEVTAPDADKVKPSVDRLPKNKKDHLELTAVQLALWHFSDNLNFTSSNTSIAEQFYPADFSGTGDDVTIGEIIARYNELVSSANSNPLTNPVPEVTITPESADGVINAPLFFTVTGKDIDGGIDLTSDDGAIKIHPATGAVCDTATDITSLPDAGGKVCVVSAVPTSVKLTAKGSSAETTTHPLYAFGAQGIVSTGPDHASDSAKGTWTNPPPPRTGGLEIVKTNNPTSETASSFGDTLTYGMTVKATGEITQHAVVVTDVVPGHVGSTSTPTTYVDGSATCVAPPTPTPANCGVTTTTTDGKVSAVRWALGDLAAGETRAVTFKVTIDVAPTNPQGNPDAVVVRNCAATSSQETGGVVSNCVENNVRVVTAVGETDSSCINDTPYFDFQSDGWFANEAVTLHLLDKNGNQVETRSLTADANGHITGHELWAGYSQDPITGVKTYPGLDVRPLKFFLSGSPQTPTVTVAYPPASAKCDAGLTIVKSNTPTGTVKIGDTINYKLAVTVPSNASYNQDGVVVTDYVPGYDPKLATSGTTTYVDGSAKCTGTILPSVGKCDVTLTKNSAGKVVKITWALGTMKAGQTTNAEFAVTADDQPGATEDTVHLDNVGAVQSDYWPTTESNKVVNVLDLTEVLGERDSGAPTAPAVLAATGTDLATQTGAALGLLLLGAFLVTVGRRRPEFRRR